MSGRWWMTAGAMIAVGLRPAPAAAQTPTSGFRASVAVTSVADDNVMATPAGTTATTTAGGDATTGVVAGVTNPALPNRDLIMRVTPGLGFARVGSQVTWSVDYSADAERYQTRTDLSQPLARQGLTFSSTYKATAHTSLVWTGAYTSTMNLAELNTATGLFTSGRARANQWLGGSTVQHRMSEHSDLTAAYTLQRNTSPLLGQSWSHMLDVRLSHRTTPHTDTFLKLNGQRFAFTQSALAGVPGTTLSMSESLDGGWALHRDRTTLNLEGGALLSEGHVGPHVTLSLVQMMGPFSLTGGYTRSITSAIGLPAMVAYDSVQAGLTFRPRGAAPERALVIRVHGNASLNRLDTADRTQQLAVVQYTVDVVKPLTRVLSLTAGYDGSTQRSAGAFTPAPDPATGAIAGPISFLSLVPRHRLSVTLAFSPWSARR